MCKKKKTIPRCLWVVFFFKCVRFYVRVLSVLSKAKYVFNVGLAKKISNSLSKKLNVN